MKHSIKNILIVDDEPEARDLIEQLLLKSRFNIRRIFEAENGIDAIEILSRNAIDVLLTDINMPVMNGIELLNILHNHHKFMHMPIVAITEVEDGKLRNLLTSWGDGYIQKPISRNALEHQILKTYGESNEYYLHG